MQNVEDVCAYVMEAMALVGMTDSVSLNNLRVVLRTAQRIFQNIDKQITVRIVQIAAGRRTEYAGRRHTINGDHTVQQAVKEQYAAFPGACQRVVQRRGAGLLGLHLWDRTPHGCAFFSRDKYDMMNEGDVIDIEVEDVCPGGPEAAAGCAVVSEFGGVECNGPPSGPGGQQARLVCDWLRELANV